ncbi:hypothetical protein IEQ34_003755 [Dendrobium chrysotoxum]|uniref:Glycosyl transferase family 1 domain-containing protein n=1 Tax=Dendrobium chrysotoxum TaxID=161865 RepID=A0AAV7HF99_DENCH|nr:hypothetical protein IEQ34_003755 [Dendrobium chrysotoxum]
MGSLEKSTSLKRTPPLRSVSFCRSLFHRPRSRLARFLLFEKVDYFQWILTAAAFFFVVILFQAFLPGSVPDKSFARGNVEGDHGPLPGNFWDLDFGEGIRFVPAKLLERIERERKEANSTLMALGRPMKRAGIRKPRLALIVGGFSADAMQLQMISIAAALKEIGYEIEVFSFEDGPMHTAWIEIGMHLTVLLKHMKQEITIDWLDYDGVLVSSAEGGLEPFKSVPVIWTIQDRSLSVRFSDYLKNGQTGLVNYWKRIFDRATVVVFTNYYLPISYSTFDMDNYFVIPSSAAEAWEAVCFLASNNLTDLRVNMGYKSEEFLVAIVGSQFEYSGMWLENALVLQGLAPLLLEFSYGNSFSLFKVGVFTGNSSGSYKSALKAVAQNFGYPRDSVQSISGNGDEYSFLSTADLVIYGSFLEEQTFPPVLLRAMSLGKLVVAPDLEIVVDGVNGFLYPKDELNKLTHVLREAISRAKLFSSAQQITSLGNARNLMVSETIQGYLWLLEKILKLPSEISSPKAIADLPSKLKEEWQWHLFANLREMNDPNKTIRSYEILNKLEKEWNQTNVTYIHSSFGEQISSINWEEENIIQTVNARKRLEEDELKERSDQPHGTWEEVYRSSKRADRAKNELHERDEKELERTGQPLCIYEPYFGEGTWPFLHNNSLYRGIGLSSKGRRPGADDIDANSRLSILGNAYYRDALSEYGAFFALANRIDRIHKNAWIGFQSWRAGARKARLSKKAELALIESIQERKHGDSFYFWVSMNEDPRNPLKQDFWSFCDAINSGNCRFVYSEVLQRLYNAPQVWDSLPEMPQDGDTWSVMHSWALPTRSFLEFIMFSRMFVDVLDALMFDEHHRSGYCYLSLAKDRHCYSRVLELLVNVWAYHSARRIVYVNPETGAMQEQHNLKSRRGKMWIKWFSFATLKSMDEDLAEEWDSEHPDRRWLWPSTGEVFWHGIYERERNIRHQLRERRRQQSRDKLRRMRGRIRQKSLGKYIKPPPQDISALNVTGS